MVADPVNRIDHAVDKNLCLQWPVRGTFKSAIGIAGDPEVLPYQQPIAVGQFIEVIGLTKPTPPDADHVYVRIPAEPKLMIVALAIPV